MIEMKNVSKWYGSFQVLTDCSTNINKGEVVVVCGPSGSGKSTLIKTINALEPFQKGEIFVDGVAVHDKNTDLPTRLRNLCRSVLGSCTAVPSTKISPFWKGSSALMVLISVDLPEPEGPHTTTTSPLLILVEQSDST